MKGFPTTGKSSIQLLNKVKTVLRALENILKGVF
jgi:hypothetical protein